MRHRISGRQLSRDADHRRAMLRNLAAGLFEHGRIRTTLPKAKAVQPLVEKIVTVAKRGDFTARRRLERMLNDRMIHAWVADPAVKDVHKDNPFFDLPDADEIEFNRYGDVRKAPRLVQHILTKVAPLFADRDGGYTRIVRLGEHRLGDGAELVVLELVGKEEGPQLSGGFSRRREQADRRAAFYAKIRKASGIKEPAAAATAVAEEEPPGEPEAEGPAEAEASGGTDDESKSED